MAEELIQYPYDDGAPACSAAYLHPVVLRVAAEEARRRADLRIFDLGAGNGSTMAFLIEAGYHVAGVDPSASGVTVARDAHPGLQVFKGSADDDLAGRFGRFPLVISLEVVEHDFNPRRFASCLYSLVEPGGLALVSTPYHGYCKNLALALTGRMDAHFTALWDGGHIKFWSIKTLGKLLQDAGFVPVTFQRVGRIPPLAKSMIALARKPL